MIEFTEDEEKRIRQLVEIITKKSIDNPNECECGGLCFSTSIALSIFLESKNLSTCIVGGKGKKSNGDKVDHFWLKLLNYNHNDIIIDATIKQFNNSEEHSIYVGRKSKNKTTRKYKTNVFTFNEILDIFLIWSNPSILYEEKDLIKRFNKNNLINASILYYEIEKMEDFYRPNVTDLTIYKYYFSFIKKNLNNKWINDIELINDVKTKINRGQYLIT